MPVPDTLSFPVLESVLNGGAAVLNSVYVPAATPGSVATTLIAIAVAIPCLLAVWWALRRSAASHDTRTTLARRVDELSLRLEATEVRLAEENSETGRLHQRVEHLASRLEALSASTSRGGLRQAIALSKHGATTRHLIDTCGLSQGEAHLIQTLYGRTPGIDQPEELH